MGMLFSHSVDDCSQSTAESAMGVPAVRLLIEGEATGVLSGCSFCPIILNVIPGDRTTRVILHIPCSLCLSPSGSCLNRGTAQGLIHNLAFCYSLSFSRILSILWDL